MTYEFTGQIVQIGPRQEFQSGSTMLPVVVREAEGRYPQDLPIEFWNERNEGMEEELKEGSMVSVTFVPSSRLYRDRRFVSLRGLAVKVIQEASADDSQGGSAVETASASASDDGDGDGDAEMPF